jgi:hypothetical protein
MKAIAVLAFLYAFSDMAFAQVPECQPTPGAGDLLACYNRTELPPVPGKRATSKVTTALNKPAVSKTPTDHRARVDDILDDENKKLDAKVKTLCRGC